MGLTKYKLQQLIEVCNGGNENLKYGLDAVKGISVNKEFIKTKADLSGVSLANYTVVHPKSFSFVTVTSRNGNKISIAYNNSKESFIVSSFYVTFKLNKLGKEALLEEYLFLLLSRPEFDRYARQDSWGSAREYFYFDNMCEVNVELPPIQIQKKYVDVYNSMCENQRNYERGLEDLKLVCDAYIDELKHSRNKVCIGKYVVPIDNRNKTNQSYKFKGLSMDNYFIDSIANANGLDFTNYKIIAPGEYGAVLMKVGRDGRLTIARNDSDENYLISPAYYAFTIKGINSDYFMANVNRSEFERRAWFSCDTSARGSLSWDEFLNLKIPNADEKEQIIVSELHKVLLTRTEINEKLKAQIKDICPILIKGSIEEARKAKEA